MKEFLQFILAMLIFCGVVASIIAFAIKSDYEMNKRECYEIYATDNVILKKCEKFFERSAQDEANNGS